MCKITMIENGAIIEIETLERMAKEITKESESYLIINEEGTILDSKNVSRLIDEMKREKNKSRNNKRTCGKATSARSCSRAGEPSRRLPQAGAKPRIFTIIYQFYHFC